MIAPIPQIAFGSSRVPDRLWQSTATHVYNAAGGRDVLILAPDLSLSHPEAVARRPGQLTEEGKLKLRSQGLPPNCQDELDIVKARCNLDKRLQIVGIIQSGKISRKDVLENILYILTTTPNNGGMYSNLSYSKYH